MGIEIEGRKAVFLRNDQYHNKFNGGGHKCCDPSVSFKDGDWQSLPDRGDVYVFTLAELTALKASHAVELEAAHARGADSVSTRLLCSAHREENKKGKTCLVCRQRQSMKIKVEAARGEGAAAMREKIAIFMEESFDAGAQGIAILDHAKNVRKVEPPDTTTDTTEKEPQEEYAEKCAGCRAMPSHVMDISGAHWCKDCDRPSNTETVRKEEAKRISSEFYAATGVLMSHAMVSLKDVGAHIKAIRKEERGKVLGEAATLSCNRINDSSCKDCHNRGDCIALQIYELIAQDKE